MIGKVLIFLTLIFSVEAGAAAKTKKVIGTYLALPVYFDVTVGLAQSTIQGGNLSARHTFMGWGGGATAAIGGNIFAGITFDYKDYSQTSDTNTTDGNLSSTRFFFAPALGARIDQFTFKFDYQTSGDLVLVNKTSNGASVSYGGPSGWRAQLFYALSSGLSGGVFYEAVTYKLRSQSGLQAQGLESNLNTSQMGINLAYLF